ncbi:MAG: nucleotidyltransferase domain-containing protein [Candidatus Natronoplasma sp.]
MDEILKAYSARFTSFLIEKLGRETSKIDNIILYGSVARGTADEESDVDIFVDTSHEMEEMINEILEEFYDSREFTLFRSKGVDNEIELKIGELSEWKDLHRSISSTGKVLWGRYKTTEEPIGTQHKIIFYWDKIGRSRSSFLNKLYGYESKEKKIVGLLEKWNGKKIGKSSIMIPIQHKEDMLELIEEYDVNAKNIEVFSLE